MRNNRKFVFGLYVVIICLTLAFVTYTRLSQCAGTTKCAVSLGRGAIWSVAWPAYWGNLAYGWVTGEDDADQGENAAVDAEWYLSQYPDVRAAVQDGRVKSAQDHYRTSGFEEKRLPAKPKFDEEFYLRAYPDVAAAVRSGQFKSGYEHYVINGYREHRKPSP